MSYDEKMAKAREMVEAHYRAAGEASEFSWDAFHKKLIAIGGTSDEGLRACSWEDLEQCTLPRLLAKAVAQVFRDKGESNRPAVSFQRAAAMTVTELVERYDPSESDNPVGMRLKSMTNQKRCVVFNDDGSVNVGITLELLNDIRSGYPEREIYMYLGSPRIVYHIGDRPDLIFDEDPLYPGNVLQPNGDSTRVNLNWADISQDAKVLIYLATRDTHEVVISNPDDAFRVHDLATGEKALSNLRTRYVKAAIVYDELVRTNQLPPLKMLRSVSRRQDPFSAKGGNQTF